MTDQDRIDSAQLITGRPIALVVRMSPFAPRFSEASIRDQIGSAFPGLPVIFVDNGTTIEAIYATE